MDNYDNMELFWFIIVGSVDDGKFIFIGWLLYDSKFIFEDQYDVVWESSERWGEEGVNLAFFIDGLKVECEQGIIIDVVYCYFLIFKCKFIIVDMLGYIQYI